MTGTTTGPLDRAGKLAAKPAARAAKIVGGPAGRAAETAAPLAVRVTRPVAPVLAPVGSALASVGSALAPLTGAVDGVVRPLLPGLPLPVGLPGPAGSGTAAPAGPGARYTGLEGTGPAGLVPSASLTTPARLAADGAGSPAARPDRSWPALTDAVRLPGVPVSAEFPAGGPDPLSSSAGAGLGLAALTVALLFLGPLGRGRARPQGSALISRSYLPLVSPA